MTDFTFKSLIGAGMLLLGSTISTFAKEATDISEISTDVTEGTILADTDLDPESLLSLLHTLKLPVVVVTTENGEIPTYDEVTAPEGCWGLGITNATKVPSRLQIYRNGEMTYDSGDYVKKESGLTVKVRGNTSARKLKKSYKLKLQKKGDLLDRGEDKKFKDKNWILLRTGSVLNTSVGFWMSEEIGQEWTPAFEYVNVIFNGAYHGLYILCESVDVNQDCRIDVDETDGYVVEADAYWWNEDIAFPSSISYKALQFTYKYPDPDDLTDEWHSAIAADVVGKEATITTGTFDEAYNCDSFARWLLAWDMLGNGDAGGSNIFILKREADSKIEMGPLWDFDHAFENPEQWAGIHDNYFYFHHMMRSENPTFRNAYLRLWQEDGKDCINRVTDRLDDFVDSQLGEDYDRSLRLEELYSKTYESFPLPNTGNLKKMRNFIKQWFDNRQIWLEQHITPQINTGLISSDNDSTDPQIFDILGRRISGDTPGIQIRNGRKVIVR